MTLLQFLQFLPLAQARQQVCLLPACRLSTCRLSACRLSACRLSACRLSACLLLLGGALTGPLAVGQTPQPAGEATPPATSPNIDAELDAVSRLLGSPTTDIPPAASPPAQPAVDAVPAPTVNPPVDLPTYSVPTAGGADAAAKAATPPASPGDTGEPIAPLDDYQQAIERAQLVGRPVVVILGAEWCTWCRKLDEDLKTAAAEPILRQWIVVHVDVDQQPEVAERLEVNALPGLRILSAVQTVAASRDGYLEPAELQAWLSENRANADPRLHQVLFQTGAPDDSETRELITLMAQRIPTLRTAAIDRLSAHPSRTAAAVTQAFGAGNLGQQLSALEILGRWHAPIADFDPWRPETLTSDGMEKLIGWSRAKMEAESNSSAAGAEQQAEPRAVLDPAAVRDLLKRMGAASPEERPAILSQLVANSDEVLLQVNSMLAASDGMSDAQRESLREVKYAVQSSSQLRLQHAGLIAALARLDAAVHRQAAIGVSSAAEVVDQPLLDELIGDTDAMVREAAVRAMGRLGLLKFPDRLSRVLKDTSTNVRMATLQALADSADEKSLQTVCDYLRQETHEDLLVRGVRYLSSQKGGKSVHEVWGQLIKSPSWRVRAAVLEAVKAAGDGRSRSGMLGESTDTDFPAELSDGVIAAVNDSDEFVVQRAYLALPFVLTTQNAEQLARLLTDHPDRYEQMIAGMESYRRAETLKPLTKLATAWVKSEDADTVRRGVLLLAPIEPAELQSEIPRLVESADRTVRLAAMRAAVRILTDERRSELSTTFMVDEKAEPWYPEDRLYGVSPTGSADHSKPAEPFAVADAANEASTATVSPPTDGTVAEVQPDSAESPVADTAPAVDTSEIDAAADLFGPAQVTTPPPVANAEAQPEESSTSGGIITSVFGALFGAGRPPVAESEMDGFELPNAKRASRRPSEWMNDWNQTAADRPQWFRSSLPAIERLLSSDDVEERLQAEVCWVVAGHAEHAGPAMQSIRDQIDRQRQPEDADSKATQSSSANGEGEADWKAMADSLLPWTPGDVWLTEIQRRLPELQGDLGRQVTLIERFLEIDDPRISLWLLNDFSDSVTGHEVELGKLLAQSQMGLVRLQNYFSADSITFQTERPYRMRSMSSNVGDGRPAVAASWLREQYWATEVDRQRAILLAALGWLDRREAADASLGVLQEAVSDGNARPLTLNVAVDILFADPAKVTADRAVMLLEHPSATVRRRAVEKLVATAEAYGQAAMVFPMAYESNPPLPYFHFATERLSSEILQRVAAELPDELRDEVRLLELAAGMAVEDDWIRASLSRGEDPAFRLALGVSLARARRVDGLALELYSQLVNAQEVRSSRDEEDSTSNHDYRQRQQASAVYALLRDLDHPDVAELRAKLRTWYGGQILEQ
ncbi:MAG: HEAT repeat domain-containing protein [Pirellulales bacterium]